MQEAGDGGVAIQRRRGCIALTPRRGSWEERLPANVRVQPDEVQRVVAAGGELPARRASTALQSVVDRSESPGDERVLVLSDSRAVLDVLEAVWRSKDASLGQPIKDGIAQLVAEGVSTRDCLYEVQSEYDDTAWVLADRRCFRLARRCMGRWVRRRLLEGVSTLRYDAMLADGKRYNYGQGGFCTEVVKGFSAGRKVEPGDTCGDMRDDTARVGFVMGRRARDSGLPHERGHARQLSQIEPEDDGGAVDDGGDDSLECRGLRSVRRWCRPRCG